MATSNHERVGSALKLLSDGMQPFVERGFEAAFGDGWFDQACQGLRDYQVPARENGEVQWDTQALLLVMWNEWNRGGRRGTLSRPTAENPPRQREHPSSCAVSTTISLRG